MDKIQAFEAIIAELKNESSDQKIKDIAYKLKEQYNIPEGIVYSFLTRTLDGSFYQTTDIRLIALFIYISLKVYGRDNMIEDVLSQGEINEAKQFDISAYKESETVELPLTIPLVIPVNDVFSTKMNVKQLFKLLNSGVINYNFDIQREAKLEIRNDNIIKTPTINQTNVDEMRDLLLNDSLKDSTLYFNAAPRTSVEGEELIYDDNHHNLTITEGTRLDVLDGFHRLLAVSAAMIQNPFIEFEFNVVFSNFTTSEALRWQSQHSKATPWTVNRKQEIKTDIGAKVADYMVKHNKTFNSMVRSSYNMTGSSNEVKVNFDVLSTAIRIEYNNYRGSLEKLGDKLLDYLLKLFELEDDFYQLFRSQNYIRGFITILNRDFNNDIEKAKVFLNELYEYSKNNRLRLSMVPSTQSYSRIKKIKKDMQQS